MMRAVGAITFVIVAGLIAGCSSSGEQATAPESSVQVTDDKVFLADHGLSGLDAEKAIDKLDAVAVSERSSKLMASVQPNQLVLTDNAQSEVALPLPKDKVYISIAPYESETHDCYYHSLTTCLGELQNSELKVQLTATDGEKVVDEQMTTFDNGFVGLWVPRDFDGTLEITRDGKSGTVPVTTSGDDFPTCITTLKMT